jgi:two-component system response regulator YesN
MVAEDEELLRMSFVQKLKKLTGFPLHVTGEAEDGKQLVELVDANPPDIVFTDVKMPEMDGLEATRQIGERHPTVKVVIISGYSDFPYVQKAIQLGAKDYLLKPVEMEDLRTLMDRVCTEVEKEKGIVRSNAMQTKDQIFQALKDYLDAHYKETISVSSLGEKFGFTQEYLVKLFKSRSGETISSYITTQRIEEAKRLLDGNPDVEIYKIASLVGYGENYFYFSRIFKARTGMQPTEYRDRNS